jgi:hypothetical protein
MITVNYADPNNLIINIPRNDMTLIQSNPTEIRQLDLNAFRLELKSIEDSSEGIAFPRTHNHNTTVTVGGVVLARVIEILDPYTITFEDGQYAVNLVGANSNVGDRVNVNQVSVRSTNSAGLQDLSTLLSSAYAGKVSVDPVDGQAGTSTPLGTRNIPVNNLIDAITIADKNSIKTLQILNSMTIDISDFSRGFTFVGDNVATVGIVLDASTNVNRCQFKDLTVSGTLDGDNVLKNCSVKTVEHVHGEMIDCGIDEQITLTSGEKASLINCYSVVVNGPKPIIDMDGGGYLSLRNYNGTVHLRNCTTGEAILDMASGTVVIDPTVTGGLITIRGVANVVDNSVGATVVDQTVTPSLFNYIMENGESFQEAVRLIRAFAAGDVEDDGAGNAVIKSLDGLVDRITATYDRNTGSRTVTATNAA